MKKNKIPHTAVVGSSGPVSASRREFLQTGVGVACAATAITLGLTTTVAAKKQRTVVILGGGVAGAKTARGIKSQVPDTRVVLIEKNSHYVSGPSIFGYLFNQREYQSLTYGYDSLKTAGVELINDTCSHIDTKSQRVKTSTGSIDYDYLVITTGTHLNYQDVEGLDLADPYQGALVDRSRIQKLRQQIENFNGGNIVVNVPSSALVCPPAPYEYALLLSEMVRRKNLDAQIILLDAGISPQPGPLSKALAEKLNQHADRIEYVMASGDVSGVDTKDKMLYTSEGDEFEYDLMTLVPKNTVAPFIAELGLGADADIFIDIDPLTMRCRELENVFAMGDVARSPLGKSAYAADVSASLCINELVRVLKHQSGQLNKKDITVACYPFTDHESAMSMEVTYHIVKDDHGIKMKTYKKTTPPSKANVDIRYSWEQKMQKAIFG